jgi:hypothetical protein
LVIGSLLRQREDPYVAKRNADGSWNILYTLHPELDRLQLEGDVDIPNDHPAVTFLTEGAFLALLKTATSEGIVGRSVMSDEDLLEEYDVVCSERDHLKEEIELLKIKVAEAPEPEPSSSESFQLSLKKLELIDRLTRLGEVNNDVMTLISKIGGNTEIGK